MFAYSIEMYNRHSRAIVATYKGLAMGEKPALIACVNRAFSAGRISANVRDALVSKIRVPGAAVEEDIGVWAFTVNKRDLKSV